VKQVIFFLFGIFAIYAQAQTPPSKYTDFKENLTGIKFNFIQGGSFEMGDVFGDGGADEKPVHIVTVSDFYLGRTAVTVAQYRAFCNATARTMPRSPDWEWQEDHPIVNVS
jgi:formylglycine-generating enzyme required for sulfatase activity